jgi:hypothetical protein
LRRSFRFGETEEELKAALDAFDDAQYLLLNSAALPVMGIGEDHFFLNEWLGKDRTLLDFETLYDYDHDDHCFQEQARQEEFPDYTVKSYRGSLYYRWARLEINGSFHYAFLSMAAGHLYGMLDEWGFDKIGACTIGFVQFKSHRPLTNQAASSTNSSRMVCSRTQRS